MHPCRCGNGTRGCVWRSFEPRALAAFCTLLFLISVAAEERLYVVQTADESLAQIALASGTVNAHVLDLGYGCNEILVHGARLYVTNSLQNTVQEIDAENHVTLRDIPLPGAVNPYALAALNEDTLLVTNFVSNNMSLLRISTGSVMGTIPVGLAPEGVLVHGERVFVCLTRLLPNFSYGAGVVMVYNRRTLAWTDSIPVGINPQFAAVDSQNRLHIVCTGNYTDIGGQVHVVDAQTLETIRVLDVGGTPAKISFGGGYAYLAAGGWSVSGEVFQYRLSDLTILRSAGNPIQTAPGATDVYAAADGSFHVSCFMADVVEQRHSSGAVVQSYNLSDGPGAMAFYIPPAGIAPLPRIVRDFRLVSAYPNPFNRTIRFEFAEPAKRLEIISIYNLLGQKVGETLLPAGSVAMTWTPRTNNGSDLVSGAYVVNIDDERGGSGVRIVYLK